MSAGTYWTSGSKFICLRTDSSGEPSYEVVAQRPAPLGDDARYNKAGDWERRSDQIVASLNMLPDLVAALEAALPVLEATQRLMAAEATKRGLEPDPTLLEQVRAAIDRARIPDIQIKGAA